MDRTPLMRDPIAALNNRFSPLPRQSNATDTDFQSDLRMSYCALVVLDIIGDMSSIDRQSCVGFINRCRVSAVPFTV